MKKHYLLNSHISSVIAEMGHTDCLAIGDCGLPVPTGTRKIDLALRRGIPSFLDTLETVLDELQVERVILAKEIRDASPDMHQSILDRLPGLPVEYISHRTLKARLSECQCVIRTGECTAYANIILVSGVAFKTAMQTGGAIL